MINQKKLNSKLKQLPVIYGTALTIGTEIINKKEAWEILNTAWNLGVRVYDTSNNYGNGKAESLLGAFLNKKHREDYYVISKVGWPGKESKNCKDLSFECIYSSIKETLMRMDFQFIDIYIAHRYDEYTELEDIIKSFDNLINFGLINAWGTSEWPIDVIEKTLSLCESNGYKKPICDQFVFSRLVDKNELNGRRKILQDLGIMCMGYSPLAQGLLTLKYDNLIPKESRIGKYELIKYDKTKKMLHEYTFQLKKFQKICEKNNLKPIEEAFRWIYDRDVIPIIGASTKQQLVDNIAAIKTLKSK